mgnify:CR=1 FL=1
MMRPVFWSRMAPSAFLSGYQRSMLMRKVETKF